MLSSIVLNGLMGFAMLLAVLFCMGDIEAAVFSETGYPFIDIFVYGTGSITGGTALVGLPSPFSTERQWLPHTAHQKPRFVECFY